MRSGSSHVTMERFALLSVTRKSHQNVMLATSHTSQRLCFLVLKHGADVCQMELGGMERLALGVGFCMPAKKTSKNRPAGAMLFEPESIDMDEHRHMLQHFVVPATLTEFPDVQCQRLAQIVIQQDGAPARIDPRDCEWAQFLTDMGPEEKMKRVTQPANSPDLNVDDV